MNYLSTQGYKGARDFFPEDKQLQDYVFSKWRMVMRRYGYQEYGAPLLEPLEVYSAKSGDELANQQTYAFKDRGDRKVAIRPEMTPSVSRMIAARRHETPYPARWFSIAEFMRYERPQKGREREFWQLNADIFGAESARADAEIIQMGYACLAELGAKPDMFTIKVNDRQLVDAIMQEYLELDTVQAQLMMKLFDRKTKVSHEDFRDEAIKIFGDKAASKGLRKIAALISAQSIDELPEQIRSRAGRVQDVLDILAESKITNVRFDASLMRGLDYYSGIVFEFFDNHPENNRALFGGGRYDGLVGLFGAEPLSAVGFAPGYTMTEVFLQTHGLLPEFTSATDVYIAVLDPKVEKSAAALARQLRAEGVNAELDVTGRKVDKQLKTALKKNIEHIIFVGENEQKEKIYPLKNLKNNSEQKLSAERIISVLRDNRRTNTKTEDDEIFAV